MILSINLAFFGLQFSLCESVYWKKKMPNRLLEMSCFLFQLTWMLYYYIFFFIICNSIWFFFFFLIRFTTMILHKGYFWVLHERCCETHVRIVCTCSVQLYTHALFRRLMQYTRSVRTRTLFILLKPWLMYLLYIHIYLLYILFCEIISISVIMLYVCVSQSAIKTSKKK